MGWQRCRCRVGRTILSTPMCLSRLPIQTAWVVLSTDLVLITCRMRRRVTRRGFTAHWIAARDWQGRRRGCLRCVSAAGLLVAIEAGLTCRSPLDLRLRRHCGPPDRVVRHGAHRGRDVRQPAGADARHRRSSDRKGLTAGAGRGRGPDYLQVSWGAPVHPAPTGNLLAASVRTARPGHRRPRLCRVAFEDPRFEPQ